ncbi:negative regulation of tumor necrosis factor (ligand) super member 11 production [Homalodisca vitripennis]|nr:negative regulation of tumor necrosis factor (ligand) super member 11 production [Homalodisca vitripennis]
MRHFILQAVNMQESCSIVDRSNCEHSAAIAEFVRGRGSNDCNSLQSTIGQSVLLQPAVGFSMFYSPPPYADLIFQDAAQQLKQLEPHQRWYSDYLGKDFMRARRSV